MRCFHSTKLMIHSECGEEGETVYEMNYILPIVEPTRHLVTDRCPSLPQPYRQYYGMASGAKPIDNRMAVVVVITLLLKFTL